MPQLALTATKLLLTGPLVAPFVSAKLATTRMELTSSALLATILATLALLLQGVTLAIHLTIEQPLRTHPLSFATALMTTSMMESVSYALPVLINVEAAPIQQIAPHAIVLILDRCKEPPAFVILDTTRILRTPYANHATIPA